MTTGIRYGLVDVDICTACALSDDAEAVKAVSIEDYGHAVRVLFKATSDVMPDGQINPDGPMPLLTCEVTQAKATVRFVKR